MKDMMIGVDLAKNVFQVQNRCWHPLRAAGTGDNETLDGDCELTFFDRGNQTAFATVNGAPDYVLGTIRAFRTGVNGFAAPDVVSTVTLGGTLHVDVTGLGNVTDQVLISADTISGKFGAVTAAGQDTPGLEKDITVSIDTGATPNAVKITIGNAAGSGSITGGTG